MRENHIKYRILAEVREEHDNLLNQDVIYNDYVSKKSMIEMAEGISSLGYDCEFIGGMTKLTELCNNKPDVSNTIFINYNYGYPSQFKRGQSPILLEMNHAKYTGSDPFVSLLVNDKYCTKKIVSKNCYKTPMSLLILTNDDTRFINEENINVPLVVKPNSEGSSLGITNDSLCQTYGQAIAQCLKLLEVFPSVIVEEYVPGYELAVWLYGNKEDFVFLLPAKANVDAALKRIAKKVGIEKNISFHCARHTFGILVQAVTGNIETTKKLMGHKSLKSTAIYADVLTNEKVKAVANTKKAFRGRKQREENKQIPRTKRTAATNTHPRRITFIQDNK